MALNVWTVSSGTSLGSFPEEDTLSIALPVQNTTGITFSVISGALPGGTRIQGTNIVGNPYIVATNTNYSFCIRATNGTSISDRTFFLTITGNNQPEFITAAGDLPIGPAKQLYVLDQSLVSYQIEAFDLDVAVGQKLTYFIGNGGGALPNGLTLSPSGLISGYIEPVVKITPEDGTGTYDESFYDVVAYDFATLPTDGYDSYMYDDVFYDYNLASAPPTTLNANYQFTVTVTDGVSFAQRTFKIFVVGSDQFRADNTAFNGVADSFSADATYLRAPVWITNSNLGTYRANNYLTIPIALYDSTDVLFRVETTNEEVYAVSAQVSATDNVARQLISGSLTTNSTTITNVANAYRYAVGQIITGVGITEGTTITAVSSSSLVISQPATSTTLNSKLYYGGNQLTVGSVQGTITPGQYLTLDNYLSGADETLYQIESVTPLINNRYRITLYSQLKISIPNGTGFYIGSLSTLPPGINFDIESGDLYGKIPYQPSVTKTYEFTITGTRLGDNITESLSASRTFTLTFLGNVTSDITWNSPSNLGTIPAGYICTLSVSATSNVPTAVVTYNLISGTLPPGLTLSLDGEILGTLNQYYDSDTGELGLTEFDGGDLTFDFNTTTVDRTFTFTVQASDQFNYSAVTREFTIEVSTPDSVPYSNIVTQPYLKSAQRTAWQNFINDPSIFTPSSIYRPNDSNFGVQTNLQMLVYAGIETEVAAAYVGAMGLNFKKKRFQFGNLEMATAVDPNTGADVYEVVYVQMVDPLEPNGKHLPLKITNPLGTESESITADSSVRFYEPSIGDLSINAPTDPRNSPVVTVDSTGYEVSNPNPDTYFPNSITLWQERLSSVGLSERNHLPLWMRSVPAGQKQQLGYTLSVPLCFCKPGTASKIMLNIQFSGFQFNQLDYQVDRFIINSVTGYEGDKYLVFKDDRITVG
jgi:Putative Ig domain